jgi:hypothetical protein
LKAGLGLLLHRVGIHESEAVREDLSTHGLTKILDLLHKQRVNRCPNWLSCLEVLLELC